MQYSTQARLQVPIAALWYGRQLGYENVISIDMGGTSFDVSLVRNGLPDIIDQADIARIRVGLANGQRHQHRRRWWQHCPSG